MNNLKELLQKRSNILSLIKALESEYYHSEIPKGRSYYKKKTLLENQLTMVESKLNSLGKGIILSVTIMDKFSCIFKFYIDIPKPDLGLYMETFYPNHTLLGSTEIILGQLVKKGNFG